MAFQGAGFQHNAFQPADGPGQGGYPAPLPHIGLLLGVSAGGNTVTPTTGHLTFTGYAPGLEQDQAVAAATGHLTFTGYVPTLEQDQAVASATGHLSFTGYAPSIEQAQNVAPTTGHLTFAGYAAGLEQNQAVAASTGHLTLTGYVPSVASSGGLNPAPLPHLGMGATSLVAVISPTTGHLTFTGYVPTQGNQTIDVFWDDAGADEGYRIKWGTATNTYSWSADVATDVLTYTITGLTYGQTYYIRIYALVGGVEQDPSDELRLTAGWGFLPTTGHLTLTGYVPTVTRTGGNGVTATTGHLTFAGYVAGVEQDQAVAASTGHLTLTGYIAGVVQGNTVSADTGHLTLSGYVAGIVQTGPVTASPSTGHLYLTGYAPTLVQTGVATTPPVVGGGKPRRRRHYVEIDGQYIEVRDHAQAVEILEKLREAAQEAAPVAVKQVAADAPPPEPPRMRVVKPDYSQEFVQQLQAQVDAANANIARVYASAWKAHIAQQQALAQQILERRAAEQAALAVEMAQRDAQEDDDINALIALGVL